LKLCQRFLKMWSSNVRSVVTKKKLRLKAFKIFSGNSKL